MLASFRAEVYSLLSLRSNRWLLSALLVAPAAMAAIRYVGEQFNPLRSATLLLDMLNGFTVPAFVLAMFFGLFAARSDEADRRHDAANLLESNRSNLWTTKVVAIAATVISAGLASQLTIVCLTAALGIRPPEALWTVVAEISAALGTTAIASVIGLAVTRMGMEVLGGALAIILAFWMLPMLASQLTSPIGAASFSAVDLNPVQLAERVTWQSPQQPLNFQGLGQSSLSLSLAWLALGIWFLLAVIAVYAPSSKPRNQRNFGRLKTWHGPSSNDGAVGLSGIRATSRLSGFLSSTYLLASDRANQLFAALAALMIVFPVALAGFDETVIDPTNHAQSALFSFGPTSLIAAYFFVAIRLSRDLQSGEIGVRAVSQPNRWLYILRQFAAFSVLLGLCLTLSLAAIAMVLNLGDHLQLQLPVTSMLLGEACLKLFALTACVVAAGIGTATLIKSPAGTLVTCLCVTLILPGVLASVLTASGNLDVFSQLNLWLPTQTWVAAHSAPGAVMTDAFQHRILNPDERNLVAGAYGALAIFAGGLRFRFGSIR